jgi:hypothetical protein
MNAAQATAMGSGFTIFRRPDHIFNSCDGAIDNLHGPRPLSGSVARDNNDIEFFAFLRLGTARGPDFAGFVRDF